MNVYYAAFVSLLVITIDAFGEYLHYIIKVSLHSSVESLAWQSTKGRYNNFDLLRGLSLYDSK